MASFTPGSIKLYGGMPVIFFRKLSQHFLTFKKQTLTRCISVALKCQTKLPQLDYEHELNQ